MFDHLDDPEPFYPSRQMAEQVRRRGRALRRRRTAGMGAVVALTVLVAGSAAGVALVDRRLDGIQRVEVAGLSTPDSGAAITILMVGTDGLRGPSTSADGTPPARTDTLLLARFDPSTDAVSLLPVPRDLWVEVDGHGPNRINQVQALGGPKLLVDTVAGTLGISIDHYVETNLEGAAAMGDSIGGLPLAFETPVRDQAAGLHLPGGCSTLDGQELMALARSRRLQAFDGARWMPDSSSDLGRIERQQVVLAALVARVGSLDVSDPVALASLLEQVSGHLIVDSGLDNRALVGLARQWAGSSTVSHRLPVADRQIGGASVLVLEDGAAEAVSRFVDGSADRTGPLATSDPSSPSAVVPTPC